MSRIRKVLLVLVSVMMITAFSSAFAEEKKSSETKKKTETKKVESKKKSSSKGWSAIGGGCRGSRKKSE
jgi:hypothetical protein